MVPGDGMPPNVDATLTNPDKRRMVTQWLRQNETGAAGPGVLAIEDETPGADKAGKKKKKKKAKAPASAPSSASTLPGSLCFYVCNSPVL
jgi:hypothetical protein